MFRYKKIYVKFEYKLQIYLMELVFPTKLREMTQKQSIRIKKLNKLILVLSQWHSITIYPSYSWAQCLAKNNTRNKVVKIAPTHDGIWKYELCQIMTAITSTSTKKFYIPQLHLI